MTCTQLDQQTQISRQHAYTMVELLVGLFLTLIIALAASQSYLMNKVTFSATRDISQVQQNLRFASHFVNKELRQAGNMGCFQKIYSHLDVALSDPDSELNLIPLFDVSVPVNIWQYEPENSSFDLSSEDAYETPEGSANLWADAMGRGRPAVLAGKAMRGSDILLINKLSEPLDIRLSENNSPAISSLSLLPGSSHQIPNGQIVVVGGCALGEMFVHSGDDNTVVELDTSYEYTPSNRAFNYWKNGWSKIHEVRVLESTLYYVGKGGDGLPALFKVNVGKGVGNDAMHEQVVGGIEMLKYYVGFDSDANRIVDTYGKINSISSIEDAFAVQVGMLSVANSLSADDELVEKNYELLPGFSVNSPDEWLGSIDRRLRYVSTNTVHLRNKGLARRTELTYK